MALVIPNSTITNAADDHAAETTLADSDILVRDGIYLVANGSGARAVKMGADYGVATIDGYLYSRISYALESQIGSTVLIGEEGVVTSGGSLFYALWLKDFNVLTVNGSIVADGAAVVTGLSSVITVSGSITAGGHGVNMDGGSLLTNTGQITSDSNGVYLSASGAGGSNARSTVTNSGAITGDTTGIYIAKDNASIDNSGTISTNGIGIFGAFDDHYHIISNSGKIIAGDEGITLAGDNHAVDNSGTITAEDVALEFTNGGGMTVTNSGTIVSQSSDAIQFDEAGAQLINTGIVAGNSRGIYANSNGASSVTAVSDKVIINHGTISGVTDAIIMMGVDNRITNTGAINGGGYGIDLNGQGTIANTATGTINARTGNGIDVVQGGAGGRTVIDNLGTIQSEGLRGIQINATNALVRNSGSITTYDTGIYALGDGNRIVNSGSVATGDEGIWANYSGTTIVNSGSVTVDEQAIRISGNGTGEALVRNSGELTADTYYTVALLTGTNAADFFNSGTVTSADGGAVFISGTADNLLRNTGDIAGETYSLLGSGGAETLRNLGNMDGDVSLASGADFVLNGGSIAGDVDLGAGDDTYRGKGAGAVSGTVSGGTGNDFLRGSAADDTLDGGGDSDTIYGRGGDDVILGGAQLDLLFGGDGDDTLSGGDAADTLNGGRGDDTLTGGAGPDTFVIIRNAGNDVITDFKDGTDKIDLSAFGLRNIDYAPIVAPALSGAGNGATLLDLDALGGSGSLLIEGLFLTQANAADFIL